MTGAIISMLHNLGMRMIAEGVETGEQQHPAAAAPAHRR